MMNWNIWRANTDLEPSKACNTIDRTSFFSAKSELYVWSRDCTEPSRNDNPFYRAAVVGYCSILMFSNCDWVSPMQRSWVESLEFYI